MSSASIIKKLFTVIADAQFGEDNQDIAPWTNEQWEQALAKSKKEMDGYLSTIMTPPQGDIENIIEFIESYPRDPNNPKPLHRFTEAERAQRRETTALMRESIVEYCFGRWERTRKYASLVRPWDTLLTFEDGGADPVNEEVVNLFSNDCKGKPEYREQRINELLKKGISREDAEKQVDEAFAKRRAEIIINKFDQCDKYFEHLDEMTDSTLPPEELAVNFFNILTVNQYYMEAVSMAANQFNIAFTEEQRSRLRSKNELLDTMAGAHSKLAYMANPLYEHIDLPDLMAKSNITELQDAHENICMSEENEALRDQMPNGTHDTLMAALLDIVDVNMTRQLLSEKAVKDYVKKYGLTINAVWSYESVDSGMVEGLAGLAEAVMNGSYLAIEQGDRAIILCPVDPDSSNVEMMKSFDGFEELYNHLLPGKLEDLMQKRAACDPGYVRSSPYFRAMRASFERLVAMGKIPDYANEEQIAPYRRQLDDLKAKCKAYLDYKKGGQTDFEKSRVRFVKELEQFTDMKLRQLDIMKKAQATLQRYDDVVAEQFDEAVKNDNRDYVAAWRAENPLSWIEHLIRDHYKTGKNFYAATEEISEASSKLSEISLDNPDAEKEVVRLVGAAALGDMYKAETDPVLSDALNKILVHKADPAVENDRDRLDAKILGSVGEGVISKLTDGAQNRSKAMLKNVLSTFDGEELAQQLKASFYTKYNLVQYKSLYATYLEPIAYPKQNAPALCDFTKQNILDLSLELFCANSGKTIKNGEQARLLLANCVLHDMALLERASSGKDVPGKLEQLFTDPHSISALQNGVMHSQQFEAICEECKINTDTFERKNLTTLLKTRRPMLAAQSLLTVTAEQINALHASAKRPAEPVAQAPAKDEPVKEAPKAPMA